MNNAIGLEVPTPKGKGIVTKLLMTEWSNYTTPSSFYEAKLPSGELTVVHQNIVEGILDGTMTGDPYARAPKGPRKVSTKKERAEKWVREAQKQRLSRGDTIKLIQQKLKVSRGTAQTYYYAVK